jgi:hypothetical protein
MTTDTVMQDVQAAITALQSGDSALAREQLGVIWERIRHAPRPLHECTLAHFMADAQDDPTHELAWDLRALEAAQRCSETEASAYHESLSMAGFMPSLHLNLADVYRRLGDRYHSMQHLVEGRAAAVDMPDGPYASMIRRGLDRLAERLEVSASPPWVSFAPQPPPPGYSDAAAK